VAAKAPISFLLDRMSGNFKLNNWFVNGYCNVHLTTDVERILPLSILFILQATRVGSVLRTVAIDTSELTVIETSSIVKMVALPLSEML
jgi:hypothetical protein